MLKFRLHIIFTFLICLFSKLALGQITSFPDRVWGDTLHAPFYHGVASGDPLDSAVIIWTRVTPPVNDSSIINITWEVSLDTSFVSPVASGTTATDSSVDWTIKIDVTSLSPDTRYYYRFENDSGQQSVIGKTRTAPNASVSDLKFAVFSCSSIYSGYFNAYARVAEKSDSLNAAIHLGDYIYDFVDSDEEFRVPSPYPTVPQNLTEWRARHNYYLLDPDLRAGKSSLPWIVLWDNHDTEWGSYDTCTVSPGTKAFLEWTPIRVPDTTDQLKIYRSFSYANLADIYIADVLMYRHVDTLWNGDGNILGNAQYQWLTQNLLNSNAKWKIIGNQRMMGGWYTNGIAQWVLDFLPNDSLVFDIKSWDGFPETRHQLFDFWRNNNIDNVIVLSGDAHVSIAMDLVENPHNISEYDPVTGWGSVGVEFLPTSISRGNMDENGAPIAAFDLINTTNRLANPQHQFADLFNHGYGYLHLKADSTIAQFWYSHKLVVEGQDSLGATLVVKDGENKWSRTSGYSGLEEVNVHEYLVLYPNPTNGLLSISYNNFSGDLEFVEIISPTGQVISSNHYLAENNRITVDVSSLASGLYYIRLNNKATGKFIKQ